jgi:hypothetical protein
MEWAIVMDISELQCGVKLYGVVALAEICRRQFTPDYRQKKSRWREEG